MSPDGLMDDLSNDFHRVKSKLNNGKGETFLEFRKGLTPRYFVVWRDVALVCFGSVSSEVCGPKEIVVCRGLHL